MAKISVPTAGPANGDQFYTRLTLLMLILHFAMEHLCESVEERTAGEVCSEAFQAILKARARWADTRLKDLSEEVRAAVKFLNLTMKASTLIV